MEGQGKGSEKAVESQGKGSEKGSERPKERAVQRRGRSMKGSVTPSWVRAASTALASTASSNTGRTSSAEKTNFRQEPPLRISDKTLRKESPSSRIERNMIGFCKSQD